MVSRALNSPTGGPEGSAIGGASDPPSPPPNPSQSRSHLQLNTHPPSLMTFNHPLQLKLDDSNFLLWEQQALAAIYGHRLKKFLDRLTSILVQFASLEDELNQNSSEEFLLCGNKINCSYRGSLDLFLKRFLLV